MGLGRRVGRSRNDKAGIVAGLAGRIARNKKATPARSLAWPGALAAWRCVRAAPSASRTYFWVSFSMIGSVVMTVPVWALTTLIVYL